MDVGRSSPPPREHRDLEGGIELVGAHETAAGSGCLAGCALAGCKVGGERAGAGDGLVGDDGVVCH